MHEEIGDVIEHDGQLLYRCVGFPQYYVTKDGRVFSLYKVGGCGKYGLPFIHELRYGQDRDGYLRLVLCKDEKKHYVKVHTLVAERFIGHIESPMVINHKDGDKTNNAVDNLEIVSVKENTNHAVIHELFGKSMPVIVEHNGRTYRFPTKSMCCQRFPDLSRDYLCKIQNGIMQFSIVDFRKSDSSKRYSPIECYYNGELFKVFDSMKQCDEYFGMKHGATWGAMIQYHDYRRKVNQYHITFPNVSTIENANA